MSLVAPGPALARALALCSLALAALPAVLAPGCAGADPDAGAGGGAPVSGATRTPDDDVDDPVDASAPSAPRRGLGTVTARGLGTVTARVPGTTQPVGGVSVVAHDVTVSVRDGFARTEIREEVRNDGDRVLEGRYVFPLPPGASVGRLALWVGRDLVEGEIVERAVASRIFRGIVDDTVRPRDPALLEWVSASEVSLTIFPIPPHASRKVLLAYDEILPREAGRAAYVLPLSLGGDRAPAIEAVSIDVVVSDRDAPPRDVETRGYDAHVDVEGAATRVRFAARGFIPAGDFVVSYARPAAEAPVEVAWGSVVLAGPARAGAPDREDVAAVRVRAPRPDFAADLERSPIDRVIVIDVSQSQSVETIAAEARVAIAIAKGLGDGDRVEVLACDSDCDRFPEGAPVDRASMSFRALARWLSARTPRGSSDLAGAILAGAKGLRSPDRRKQLVVLGDGAPTSGELSAATIAARVRPAIAGRDVDLALLGVGRSVDEVVLAGLARELGGTYQRVANGEPLSARAASLAASLDAPVLADAKLVLPAGLSDPAPRALPNLRFGDEVVVYARRTGPLDGAPVALTGRLRDRDVRVEGSLPAPGAARDVPAVPRLFAEARLAELAADDSREARAESIALSKRFHVMARGTAWLVLESDRMFAEFGIPRTVRPQGDDRLGLVAPRGGAPETGILPGVGESLAGDSRSAAAAPSIGAALGAMSSAPSGAGLASASLLDAAASSVVAAPAPAPAAPGFGAGHGRVGGSHRAKPAMIRMGATTVTGRLPPETVQRIVRLNFGRFRNCYERGLTRNPDLAGRVVTRFVIDRDGAVVATSDSGSDLPDREVVSCVVRSFGALSFPQPEAGVVTVLYPIVFHSDGTRPGAPPRAWPDIPRSLPVVRPAAPSDRDPVASAVVAPSNEDWRALGDAAIGKLTASVEASPLVRARHESLVRGLLARGRFAEALAAARRLVDLDPDWALARELLAGAHAASGDGASASRALDELAEVAPRSAPAHARAARAFEAIGDERRACAHWRALAELRRDARPPDRDESLGEALRCKARVDGERDESLAAARAAGERSAPLARLATALASGLAPTFASEGLSAGALEASTSCAAGPTACPSVVVLAPDGAVISPFTPSSRARSGRGAVASPGVVDGVYRVLVVGAGTGDLTVRALGSRRTFHLEGSGVRTVATVTVRGAG